MSGLTRERGDTVIGPRTSQSVLSSLLYRLCVSQPFLSITLNSHEDVATPDCGFA